MACESDETAEHLITALVLTLAHDLAVEGRRKKISGRDYIGDAVELIRESRPHVIELLRRDPAQVRAASAVLSEKPGNRGLTDSGR